MEFTRSDARVAALGTQLVEIHLWLREQLAALRSELDGLAALLESHFVYEEKKLITALNALESPGSAEQLFGIVLGDEPGRTES